MTTTHTLRLVYQEISAKGLQKRLVTEKAGLDAVQEWLRRILQKPVETDEIVAAKAEAVLFFFATGDLAAPPTSRYDLHKGLHRMRDRKVTEAEFAELNRLLKRWGKPYSGDVHL